MEPKGLFKFVMSILTVFILLSGCSTSKPSLELVSSTVEIRIDKDRLGGSHNTSGEKKGEVIVPYALSYNFVLKNTGSKTLGGAEKLNVRALEYDDGIKILIQPNEELKEISEELMGVNIYDREEYFGMGIRSAPVLEPNQEREYAFDFHLGVSEENTELKLAPPLEQLERLKEHAMNATLIVSIEGEEIARFDLSNLD